MRTLTTSFIVTKSSFINRFTNRSFDRLSFDSLCVVTFIATVSGFDIWEVKHNRPEIVIQGFCYSTLKCECYLKDWSGIYGEIMGCTQEDAYNDPCPETFEKYAEAKAYFHN